MKKPVCALLPALALLAVLAACSSEAPLPPVSLNYGAFGSINLAVRDISLTNRSLPQVSPPIAGGPFQPTLAEAVQHWVDGRLRATGASGQAIVIIRDIELTSRPIPTAEGMSSWFKRQQGSRYLGRIAVEIDAHGSPGFAIASAEAHRAVSLPENPTEDEEQEAYDQLLEGLMADLNRNLERSIDRHMQDFLVNAPALPQAAPAPSMMPSAP